MADKQLKDQYIGARVNGAMAQQIDEYISAAQEMDVARLIRLAVPEYIANHPIQPAESAETVTQGE